MPYNSYGLNHASLGLPASPTSDNVTSKMEEANKIFK